MAFRADRQRDRISWIASSSLYAGTTMERVFAMSVHPRQEPVGGLVAHLHGHVGVHVLEAPLPPRRLEVVQGPEGGEQRRQGLLAAQRVHRVRVPGAEDVDLRDLVAGQE